MEMPSKVSNFSKLENQEYLISKIDEIVLSRMKVMEENFKRLLDYQNSKTFATDVKAHGFNDNLQFIKNNDISLERKIKAENEIQNIQHGLEIKSLNKDEIAYNPLTRIDKVYRSLAEKDLENEDYHVNEFCSACKFQILKNKFICVMCENFILCSHCEEGHLQHPLLKVNVINNRITTKEELIQYCVDLHNKTNKNQGFIQKNLNKIINLSPSKQYIKLDTKGSSLCFDMNADSKLNYPINLENITNENLEETIILSAINNKTFKVNSKIVENIESRSIKAIEILLSSPNEYGTYEFEITAHSKNKGCLSNNLKFIISVVPSNKYEEADENLMFAEWDELFQLPKEDKIYLSRAINQGVIPKDLTNLANAVRRNKNDIMAAIDDLTAQSQPQKQYRGECYYNMHL
jgi:hypothetical protein